MRRAIRPVLLSVAARHVHFLLSAREGVDFEGGGADVVGGREQDVQVGVRVGGVEMQGLRHVYQAYFYSGFRSILSENLMHYLKYKWRILFNLLLRHPGAGLVPPTLPAPIKGLLLVTLLQPGLLI